MKDEPPPEKRVVVSANSGANVGVAAALMVSAGGGPDPGRSSIRETPHEE